MGLFSAARAWENRLIEVDSGATHFTGRRPWSGTPASTIPHHDTQVASRRGGSGFRWTREGKQKASSAAAPPMDGVNLWSRRGDGFWGPYLHRADPVLKGAEPGDGFWKCAFSNMGGPRPSRKSGICTGPDLWAESVRLWWGYHYDEFLSEPSPRGKR